MNGITFGQVLIVGMGGFVGSSLRFVMHHWVQKAWLPSAFPLGTLAVNMIGCLLIGLVIGLSDVRGLLDQQWRLFLAVGVLGGFTTYSSFAYENFALLSGAEFFKVGLNIVVQIVLGLLLAWAGYQLARVI
ncbi:MAG: fluoride efflux transporter CrcB [Gammaproteobacteria bacterium]|nr:fluoride efflux transporter CrcB [Gammaproteobacteria bacterium]